MAIQAREVLERASIILQDAGNTRWTLPVLLKNVNDGVREIAVIKPNALSSPVILNLVRGTRQTLGDDQVALIRAIRNVVNDPDPGATWKGTTVITPVERHVLDQQLPGWQNDAEMPYSSTVAHIVQDQADPRTFYVAPGNDGTGTIECIVATLPPDLVPPANPLTLNSYTENVLVPDYLRNALVDYVLYRAFSVDSGTDPDASARAEKHYGKFMTGLGARLASESVASTATTKSQTLGQPGM